MLERLKYAAIFIAVPDDSSAKPAESESEDDSNDDERGPVDTAGEKISESHPTLPKSICRRQPPSPCHWYDHEIREENRRWLTNENEACLYMSGEQEKWTT